MQSIGRTINTLAVLFVSVVGIAAILILQEINYSKTFLHIVILAGFVLAYAQIPGFIALRLMGLTFKSRITKYPVGLFVGIFILFAEYYIGAAVGNVGMLVYSTPLISLLGLIVLLKKKMISRSSIMEYIPRLGRLDVVFVVFLVVLFIVASLQLRNFFAGTLYSDEMSIHPDLMFHGGISNALAQGYPPLNQTVNGELISYHYFRDLFYSIAKNVTQIAPDRMILSFSPFMTTYALGTSTYALFRELTMRKRLAGIYSLITLLPGATLLSKALGVNGNIFTSGMQIHAWSDINSVGMSLSVLMVFFLLLSRIVRDRVAAKDVFLVAGGIMLVTGFKGPFGVLATGAVFAAMFFDAIVRRKFRGRVVCAALLAIIAFAVVYLLIISGIQFGGEGEESARRLFHLTLSGNLTNGQIYTYFNSKGWSNMAVLAMTFIGDVVIGIGIMAFPIIFAIPSAFYHGVIKRNPRHILSLTLTAVAIAALFFAFFTVWIGTGQGYFRFPLFIPIMLVSIMWLEERERKSLAKKILRSVIAAVMCICMTAGIYDFVVGESSIISRGLLLAANDSDSVESLSKVGRNYKYIFHEDSSNSILKAERKSLEWMSKNTPRDALCATNNYNFNDKNNVRFYYSTYSQRKFYLEGFGYSLSNGIPGAIAELIKNNAMLFGKNDDERYKKARALGVKYLVVSKRIETGFATKDKAHFKQIHSSRYIDIYEVQESD